MARTGRSTRRRRPVRGAAPPGRAETNPWVRTSEPLFWLTGAGHEFITPAANYFFDATQRSDRPHVVLQLTLAGAGFFEKHRRRAPLPAGTAFFHAIPGDFRYGYPAGATDTYEQVFVSMTGPLAFRWYERIVAAHGHVLRLGPAAAESVAPLMLALARHRAEAVGEAITPPPPRPWGDVQPLAPQDRYLVSAQLNHLVMTLLSALTQSRLALRPLATRALDLIHARAPDAHFDVAALAGELDCSREHLARVFRAATGVPPGDYLIQHRLRLAARHLRAAPDKLEAVARRAGFATANYLCRAFRQRVGVTPGQFRARPWLTAP